MNVSANLQNVLTQENPIHIKAEVTWKPMMKSTHNLQVLSSQSASSGSENQDTDDFIGFPQPNGVSHSTVKSTPLPNEHRLSQADTVILSQDSL